MVPVNEDEGMHPQRAFVREIIKLFEYHLEGYDVNIHPDDLGPGKTSILGIEYLALEDDLIQFLFQEKESCLEILDDKGNVKALIRARSPFLGFLE